MALFAPKTSDHRAKALWDSPPNYPERQQGGVGSVGRKDACPAPSHEHRGEQMLVFKTARATRKFPREAQRCSY